MQRNSKRQSTATNYKSVRINPKLMRTLFHYSLSVGIIGVGVANHHVAERSAIVDGDTDAKAVVVRTDHGLEVSGRRHPVSDNLLMIPYETKKRRYIETSK